MTDGTDNGAAPLTFSVELGEDDLLAVSLNSRTRWFGLSGRQFMWLYWGYMALVFIALFYLANQYSEYMEIPDGVRRGALAGLGVLLSLMLLAYPWYYRWQIRRKSHNYQSLPMKLEMNAKESGWEVTTPTATSSMAWTGFERAVETRNYFILYSSRLRGLVVPKSALSGLDQLTALRQLVQSKISDYQTVSTK